MKQLSILLYILFSLLVFSGCVDDYEDSNPAPLLDSPASFISSSADSVSGGETVTLSVAVIDAPGLIDSIGVSSTDDLGSFTIDQASLNAARGNEKGSISINWVAPFTYEGEVVLTVIVYDGQVNDEGESAKKGFSLTETVFVEYLYNAPVFTTNIPESLSQGEVFSFEIDITEALGEGVDSISIFSTEGEIEINQASLAAIKGQSSGKVTGTYTAPESYIGDVEITFTVIDALQQRETVVTEEVTIGYEFDIPTLVITGPNQLLARRSGTYGVAISADGLIDTVIVQGFARGTEDSLGTVIMDEASYDAFIGESSGTLSFDFSELDFIGYISLTVTVIDRQGAQTTEEILILNQLNCNFNINDFLGEFDAEEPGYATYPVTFTADPVVENRIIIDNFWDSGGTPYYDINPLTGTVTLPSQIVNMGGEDYTVVGSGELTICEDNSYIGSFYVDYTVTNSDGEVEDENTHTFTR